MRHTFTQNLIVKKLYNETSSWENDLLNTELSKNWKLKEDFEEMQEVVKKLDSEFYRPSKSSIQIILDYSRKKAPVAAPC